MRTAPPASWPIVLLAAFTSAACARGGPEARPTIAPSANSSDVGSPRAAASPFGFGRPPTAEEVRAWDISVSPDGRGLPPGRGTVEEGRVLYAAQCVACHGPEGEGGPYDRLASRRTIAGFPFGTDPALLSERTIGNYWPYATTLYDYIQRAMPQAVPGSLAPGEVYALVAYLLYLNHLVPADAVMDAATLPRVRMPARDRFVRDDRRGGPEVR